MQLRQYQQILQENVRTSVGEVNLKWKWVMEQDNKFKHTKHATHERLK